MNFQSQECMKNQRRRYACNAIEKIGIANMNNASLIVKYLQEQKMLGGSSNYKTKCGYWPCRLSELTGHRNFQDLNEGDIQKFAAYYNKGEIETDPKHHWKGTYNQ